MIMLIMFALVAFGACQTNPIVDATLISAIALSASLFRHIVIKL